MAGHKSTMERKKYVDSIGKCHIYCVAEEIAILYHCDE
jgi:hypothetical protein